MIMVSCRLTAQFHGACRWSLRLFPAFRSAMRRLWGTVCPAERKSRPLLSYLFFFRGDLSSPVGFDITAVFIRCHHRHFHLLQISCRLSSRLPRPASADGIGSSCWDRTGTHNGIRTAKESTEDMDSWRFLWLCLPKVPCMPVWSAEPPAPFLNYPSLFFTLEFFGILPVKFQPWNKLAQFNPVILRVQRRCSEHFRCLQH